MAGWGNSNTETHFVAASETSFNEIALSTGDLIFNNFLARGVPAERVQAINFLGRDPKKHLNNTALQIEALAEHFADDSEPLVGLAFGYHIPRIIRHARAFGLNMNLIAADSLWETPAMQDRLDSASLEEHAQVIDALPVFAKRERFVRALCLLDGKGHLLNLCTGFQGPRLHDIDTENGQAIISTARKRQQELALGMAAGSP